MILLFKMIFIITVNYVEKSLQHEEQSLKKLKHNIRNDNDHKMMLGDNCSGDNPAKIPRSNLSNRYVNNFCFVF